MSVEAVMKMVDQYAEFRVTIALLDSRSVDELADSPEIARQSLARAVASGSQEQVDAVAEDAELLDKLTDFLTESRGHAYRQLAALRESIEALVKKLAAQATGSPGVKDAD
jgi:hypothetical protein